MNDLDAKPAVPNEGRPSIPADTPRHADSTSNAAAEEDLAEQRSGVTDEDDTAQSTP